MTPKSTSSVFSRSSRDTNGSGTKAAECAPIELLQHRSAQRGLAGADLAGQDNQTFPALYAGQQLVERRSVRRAAEQESRIGGQAERLLVQPVERFVHERCRHASPPRGLQKRFGRCVRSNGKCQLASDDEANVQ